MQKKRELIVLILLLIFVLFTAGCLEFFANISIDMPDFPLDINKRDVYNQSFNLISTFSEPQKVTINLSTNDSRIGISWDGKTFQNNLIKEKNVDRNLSNKERFYFKVIDLNIPPGDYEIIAQITVEKNKVTNFDKMIVRVGSK